MMQTSINIQTLIAGDFFVNRNLVPGVLGIYNKSSSVSTRMVGPGVNFNIQPSQLAARLIRVYVAAEWLWSGASDAAERNSEY